MLWIAVALSLTAQDMTWVGQRVVQLEGRGQVDVRTPDGGTKTGETNIVSVVDRIDDAGVWLRSPAGVVGRARGPVILLQGAAEHFSGILGKDPMNYDALLRRGEVFQATNQREAALRDYAQAIRLQPQDSFLYMRRARLHNAMRDCRNAVADLEVIMSLRKDWEEPYALGASIFSGCPDETFRDPKKSVDWAEIAIALQPARPTLLTILASAHAAAGQYEKAVYWQRRALASADFPTPYRSEGQRQLERYEKVLASERR